MSRVLLLIELKGGNDGLNTLVPYADARYREADAARLAAAPAKPAKKATSPPAKRPAKVVKQTIQPADAHLEPGSLVLNPAEVAALDHLLATHPATRQVFNPRSRR